MINWISPIPANDVALDLTAGTATFENGDVEIIDGFEAVTAGSGDNIITGTTADNVIDGGYGKDTIFAGEGDDFVYENHGIGDEYYGGLGFDTIDISYTSVGDQIDLTAGTLNFSNGVSKTVQGFEAVNAGTGNSLVLARTGRTYFEAVGAMTRLKGDWAMMSISLVNSPTMM